MGGPTPIPGRICRATLRLLDDGGYCFGDVLLNNDGTAKATFDASGKCVDATWTDGRGVVRRVRHDSELWEYLTHYGPQRASMARRADADRAERQARRRAPRPTRPGRQRSVDPTVPAGLAEAMFRDAVRCRVLA